MNASALHTIALQKQSPSPKRGLPSMLAILGISIAVYIVIPAIRGTSILKAWKETR